MLKNKDKYGKQYKPKNHQKNNIHINNWNKHNFNDKQCILFLNFKFFIKTCFANLFLFKKI